MANVKPVETEPSAIMETYTDWAVRCITPVAIEGATPVERVCEMFQELRQQKDGKRVVTVSVRANDDNLTGRATIISPFGILLSEGVRLEIEETELFTAEFQTCFPNGCIATAPIDAKNIEALIKAKEAKVVMTALPESPFNVAISLAGFKAAWNRLAEL